MKVEYKKIEEIASRLRQYEEDGKPRYFNISYTSRSYVEPQLIGGERLFGEQVFRERINSALYTYKADKIIINEFNQKSRNVKTAVSTIEILIDREDSYPATLTVQPDVKEETKKSQSTTVQQQDIAAVLEELGYVRQDMRSEVAKEYQLIKEQEEKERLINENEKLKLENVQLEKENSDLLKKNTELFEEVEKLRAYVPDNFKIGNLSVTKTLGSILGVATETLVKNIVTKKPERVRTLLGDVAFEQLSGFMEDETDELGATETREEPEPLEPLESVSEEEQQQQKIAEAIHALNLRISLEELGKIHLMYAFIVDENEAIDHAKLNQLVQFIARQHNKEQ